MQPADFSDYRSLVDGWISDRVSFTPVSALQLPFPVRQQLIQIILEKKEALGPNYEHIVTKIQSHLNRSDQEIEDYFLKNPQELTSELTAEMPTEFRSALLQGLSATLDSISYPISNPETHRLIALAVSMMQKRKQL